MPNREAECLSYFCHVYPPASGTVVVVDLSQSMSRLPYGVGRTLWITPGAKMVMLDSFDFQMLDESVKLRRRPLLGAELLHMQGLDVRWLSAEEACGGFTN